MDKLNFTIPANIFQAVALAQSKDPTCYYLNGVFVEPGSITATNGHILIRYEMETGLPEDHEGLIVYVDPTEKGLKAKAAGNLTMVFDTENEIVQFYNGDDWKKRHSVCGFSVIDGTYPDYRQFIPDHSKSSGVLHVGLNADYIGIFAKADKLIRSVKDATVCMTFGESASDPISIQIGGVYEHAGRVTAVQMPLRSPYE